MKKYLYAIGAALVLVFLFTVGFQFLYSKLTVVLGNFNNYLADLIVQAGDGLGFLLVGASFIYGVIHAIGPGHGKFVLSSYAIASNIKFLKVAVLSLTISLLQGLTAVFIGTFALLFFESSVTKFFKLSNSLLLVSSLMLISLGIFWFGRALYRIVKLTKVVREEKKAKLRAEKQEEVHSHCCGQNYNHNHDHSDSCTHNHDHSHCCGHNHNHNHNHDHSSCSHDSCAHDHHNHEHNHDHHHDHEHHEGCGCKNHLDWEKYSQIDNFRDRMIMSLSVILRPCTGAIFVLIFAYSIDKWWWGVASAMVMALGTGIGLLFTVQIVTFIKRVGFDRYEQKPSPKRALIFQYLFAAISFTLIAVAGSAIYNAENGGVGNRVFTRENDAGLLEQNNEDKSTPLLEPLNQENFNKENFNQELEGYLLGQLNNLDKKWQFKL